MSFAVMAYNCACPVNALILVVCIFSYLKKKIPLILVQCRYSSDCSYFDRTHFRHILPSRSPWEAHLSLSVQTQLCFGARVPWRRWSGGVLCSSSCPAWQFFTFQLLQHRTRHHPSPSVPNRKDAIQKGSQMVAELPFRLKPQQTRELRWSGLWLSAE